MKKLLLIIFLFMGCTPLLKIDTDKSDYFNLVFVPHSSEMEIGLPPDYPFAIGIKDDMMIIILEEKNKILIYPYYISDPLEGGLILQLKTESKDKFGYLGKIYDPFGERLGYVSVTNGKYLDITIDLSKTVRNLKSTLKIKGWCKTQEEIRAPTIEDLTRFSYP